jgi:hypothetical protein
MRKLFLYLILTFFYFNLFAQEEKSPITEYLYKRKYQFPDSSRTGPTLPDGLKKWPDTLFYNTVYKARLLGSPTIPISFSRIEKVNGNYIVTPTIAIGYGYTWFYGDFIFNENDKISINPTFSFGLLTDIALQNNFSFEKIAGLFVGGFIGVSSFSIFFGYDFISSSGSMGLGGRIDLYTISQIYLKPIGKVRESRRHKSIAPMISEE